MNKESSKDIIENKNEDAIFYRRWDNIKEEKSDGTKVLRLPQNVVDSLKKKTLWCLWTLCSSSLWLDKKIFNRQRSLL